MTSVDGEEGAVVLVDTTGRLEGRYGDDLVAAGFDVRTADTARRCLHFVDRREVDAILSEYALPDVDGLRLLRSIRVSRPLLPFLLAPDGGSEALAGEAFEAGASGYVPREADPDTVVTRVRRSRQRVRSETGPERQSRYRHLIEISPAPINVFDEHGESIWGNDAVLELLGLDGRDELIGRSIFEFIHPEDHPVASGEVDTVIDRKQSVGPTHMKLRKPDGEIRHILVSTAIGEFLGTDVGQAVVVDITDRYERDRQLQILDHWLRHNIRNEVNVISGLAERIEEEVSEDVAENVSRLQAHCRRLVGQSNAQRKVIELLTDPPDPETQSVTRIVERQVEASRDRFPDATIALERADELDAPVIPDFGQAIGELVENAIQHNDADRPAVTVRVISEADAGGLVRIADNGPGIPATERDALRLDREIDQLTHGSGLGLVFARWVLRLAGGSISFGESEEGGTVVTLHLPAATKE